MTKPVIPLRHHLLEAEHARLVTALRQIADTLEGAPLPRVAELLTRIGGALAELEAHTARIVDSDKS